jgi:ABC-type branched-subunit amino acid transport system substrate-binding protein
MADMAQNDPTTTPLMSQNNPTNPPTTPNDLATEMIDQNDPSAQMPIPQMDPRVAPITWSRFMLFIVLIVLFFIFNQPFNVLAFIGFMIALLGANLFKPIYQRIDHFDQHLERFFAPSLQRVVGFARPIIDTYTHVKNNREKVWQSFLKALSWSYTIIITVALLLLATKNLWQSMAGSVKDSVCVRSAMYIQQICDTGIGMEPLSTDEGTIYIGLINGSNAGPFDRSSMNGAEKQVESLIFSEDAQACSAPNHMTVAIVTMLSRTIDDVTLSAQVGLDDLRGAYLAQKDYNNARTHQTKLCLVIGNIGTRLTTDQAIPLMLKRLIVFSKHDPTFRGIVGFPFSQTSKVATDTLKNWQQTMLPIVSPSATSDQLDNIPNFYRVVSSDSVQSETMVEFLAQEYHTKSRPTPARVAVFTDNSDAYSKSLHDDFIANVANDAPNIITYDEHYHVEDADSLKAPLADAILQKNVDFIFFAGYAYDLDALESQLQSLQLQQPLPHKAIPIVGGDGLYDLNRYIDNTYSIVYSTVYASPVPTNDPFTVAYSHTFGPVPTRSSAQDPYSLLPPHAILAYDATSTYLATLDEIVLHGQDNSQQNFNAALATISFNGKSGLVSFHGNSNSSHAQSNPLKKEVYILCTDRNHTLHVAAKSVPGEPTQFLLKDVANCS